MVHIFEFCSSVPLYFHDFSILVVGSTTVYSSVPLYYNDFSILVVGSITVCSSMPLYYNAFSISSGREQYCVFLRAAVLS